MANYQLYRSNVLLGGQMKYDVVLDSKEGELCVSDFHITPISNKCPYNKNKKDTLLNYPHQENIVSFYKNIKSSFYKDFADKTLTNLYPIPGKSSNSLLNTETTYEMGCKRPKSYQLYGKQFEFFCPLWLEHLGENDTLYFTFKLYSDSQQKYCICEKTLYFEKNNENTQHDKFIKYFDDYMSYIKCRNDENINDWIFDINKTVSSVIGLNVSNGKINNLKLNNLFDNLTRRERPVLETNNIIINQLSDHHLIVKPLFNFNFCFNIDDIFTNSIAQSIKGGYVYISVETGIKKNNSQQLLELVDFYSNHEFIPKKKTIYDLQRDNPQSSWYSINVSDVNVLDYLQEYKCIDLISKNKIIQNTIHWENVKYGNIFNFYEGFGGINEGFDKKDDDNNNKITFRYLDQDTLNLDTNKYEISKNQVWCNTYYTSNSNASVKNFIIDILNDTSNKYDNFFSYYSNNVSVKNIDIELEDGVELYIMMIINTFDNIEYNSLKDLNGEVLKTNGKTIGVLCSRENHHIIVCNIEDIEYMLPFENFKTLLTDIEDTNINKINKIKMKYVGENINILSSLSSYNVPGPSLSAKEINYYKSSIPKSISRNLNRIRPMFIKKQDNVKNYINYRYYKFNMNDSNWENKSDYILYCRTKYKPLYPSINYWCLGYIDENYSVLIDQMEYHYFNNNKYINLYPSISVEYFPYDENGNYKGLNEKEIGQIMKDKIKDLYRLNNDDEIIYITSLYEYRTHFKNIIDNKDIYNIEIKLK